MSGTLATELGPRARRTFNNHRKVNIVGMSAGASVRVIGPLWAQYRPLGDAFPPADDCPSGILANLTRGGEKVPTKICGVPQIAKRRHTATTFAGSTAKSGLWSSAREYLECFCKRNVA